LLPITAEASKEKDNRLSHTSPLVYERSRADGEFLCLDHGAKSMKPDKKARMSVHIALLRGVMPIGRNRVPMADLRKLLMDLGFDRVRTYIASGNAVFRSDELAGAALEALLEGEIAKRIGPSLDVMVRDACAWDRLIAANPFPEDATT